jgi:hypothetical protein
MKVRRWILATGIVLGAVLLAFPLRGVVNQLIVLPLAYLLYVLELLYLSIPQVVWWVAIVAVVLVTLGSSLLIETKSPKKPMEPGTRERGRVESLAAAMRKSRHGTYFKWLVANALGRLAYQILVQRDRGRLRSVFAPLDGDGWDPSPGVRDYLEKGFHGSFTDLPAHTWAGFVRREQTALDHDVAEVVEFLESKVEGDSLPLRG